MSNYIEGFAGNRADAPTRIAVTDGLAREFMRSPRYSRDSSLYNAIVNWLADKAGKNIAWEWTRGNDEAIGDLYDRVRRIEG